jgi:hypothetical protein
LIVLIHFRYHLYPQNGHENFEEKDNFSTCLTISICPNIRAVSFDFTALLAVLSHQKNKINYKPFNLIQKSRLKNNQKIPIFCHILSLVI